MGKEGSRRYVAGMDGASDPAVAFAALVTGPPPNLHLDRACALMAAAFTGADHTDRVMTELDQLASMVADPSLRGVLAAMRGRVTGNRDHYYDPRNSFIDEVLRRGLGLPITLSVVAIEIGRRAGVPIVGIGLPGHFMVRDAGHDVQSGRQRDKVGEGCSRDAHHHGSAAPHQKGELVDKKRFHAVIVEADRVEQAGRGLDGSPWNVALAGQRRDCLRYDAAQSRKVEETGHLTAVAERAGGHHDRVGQPEPAQRDGQINGRRRGRQRGRRWCRHRRGGPSGLRWGHIGRLGQRGGVPG
jgi:hypothetical protein